MRNLGRFGRVAVVASAIVLGACAGESADGLLESAKKHVADKNAKGAVIQLKNALQKNPNLTEARFMLGRLMLDAGDVSGAAIELQKAQDLGFDPDKLVPLLAKVLIAKGEPGKVITQFGKQELKTPAAQAELQTAIASAYMAQNKATEAQRAIDAALRADPNSVSAKLLQARMLAVAKDIAGATAVVEKVIGAAPENSEAYQLQGDLMQFSGDQTKALASFRAAIERDKNNIGAHISALGILLTQKDVAGVESQLAGLREVAPTNPQTRYFSALLAFEKKDIKQATEQVQLLLKQVPDNVRALQLAGALDMQQGALVAAEAHLAKALQLAPNQIRTRGLLAQVQLKLGEPVKAIKLLQPIVDSNGANWETYSLMAQAQLTIGDAAKAEAYFAKSAKLNPKDARSRTALALVQLGKGNEGQGVGELHAISEADPGPMADLALISVHLRKKEYELALKAIDQLEKKSPGQATASHLRGQTELRRGRRDQARVAFEAALKIKPDYFPSAASLAGMDVGDGKPELAQQRFEKMVAASPRDVRSGLALISLRAQMGAGKDELVALTNKLIKANPAEAPPRLALIGLQLERKDFKGAMASAQDGVATIPTNLELLGALGQSQYLAGDVNQALSTYNKLANLQPNSPQPYMRLAELQMLQKDSAGATASIKKALAIQPDFLPAQTALAAVEASAGQPKVALQTARAVQKQRPKESAGYMLEGDLEGNQKNWTAAAKAYRAGLEKQQSTELAIKLHRALSLDKRQPEAQQFEQQWLKQNTKDAAFNYYLADAALMQANYEVAQKRYESVLSLAPNHAPALNNLAWLLNRAKKPEALEFALRATKLAPKEPAFMDTLAEIYASSGQLPKAIQVQEAAVAANPELAVHRLHLARYYVAANDKVKAKTELARLAALGDKFNGQDEVKAMQDKL